MPNLSNNPDAVIALTKQITQIDSETPKNGTASETPSTRYAD